MLRLVPLSARHARDLEALADDDTMPWGATPARGRRQGVLAFIARAQRLRARGAGAAVAICDAERLVGIAVLAREATADRAELGYWIARPDRGRGYATAAVRQLLSQGFDGLRLASVFARCPSTNRASARVVEKLGFRLVGLEPSDTSTTPAEPVHRYELARPEWDLGS